VTGVDGEGDSVSPTQPIEAVAGLFTVHRAVFDPAFEQINEPNVVGVRTKGFRTRIQRNVPVIVRS
jgi:hypothetical protein